MAPPLCGIVKLMSDACSVTTKLDLSSFILTQISLILQNLISKLASQMTWECTLTSPLLSSPVLKVTNSAIPNFPGVILATCSQLMMRAVLLRTTSLTVSHHPNQSLVYQNALATSVTSWRNWLGALMRR